MSDQDIIYPYIIDTTSIQGMRIKKNINNLEDCWLIQNQILQTQIIRIVWQTVRRITNEILGVQEVKKSSVILTPSGFPLKLNCCQCITE